MIGPDQLATFILTLVFGVLVILTGALAIRYARRAERQGWRLGIMAGGIIFGLMGVLLIIWGVITLAAMLF